jgi:hypothetical protein
LARFLTEFAKSWNASHTIDKKDREQAKLSAALFFRAQSNNGAIPGIL